MTTSTCTATREIGLRNGFVAIVDEEDYDRLSAYKWEVYSTNGPRALRWICQTSGKRRSIFLHREAMGAIKGEHILAKNGNYLDCRKSNLCARRGVGRARITNLEGPKYARPELAQPDNSEIRHLSLTKGKVAIIDADRYEEFAEFAWQALNAKSDKFYAVRKAYRDGKRRCIYLHREVMGLALGRMPLVDHINCNGLDCRKENLRLVDYRQNVQNKRPQKVRAERGSRYKGVTFVPRKRARTTWRSHIFVHGKHIELGCYESEIEAARVYDAAAREHFGEYAWLNFPEG